MATIVLQAAGAFVGGVFGSVGSAIGSAAGALAGYTIDRALIDSTRHYEGPRLTGARPFTAEEGAPLPRIYGTVRLGGTLIWATRFEEESTTTRQGGKGGPKSTTYSYFANAAFALCEGEIAGVRRIWADGREVDRERVEIRIYKGDDAQLPDPLIEAKQGTGNTPAYRGTAYVVIERFPIDDCGRRLPQFQFEVMRPAGSLHERIRSVALIPGSTEYGLSPTLVTQSASAGETRGVNRHVLTAATDLEASLDELQMLCPNLETVALVVSWFGEDLRAGACRIRPLVTQPDPQGFSADWMVSGEDRTTAGVVSQANSGAAYGGTPSDRSVMDAIAAIKARGLKVTLYPFMMMDIPADNALPDPHGGAAQSAYPWRGRITCDPAPGREASADKSAAAASQVSTFLGQAGAASFQAGEQTILFTGAADDWGYRRFLLHHAHLAAAAGGVDGFLLGSELRGLTTLRDGSGRFPFVDGLRQLAGEVRALLGPGTTITYGADWSEYFGHQPQDGSGDVLFHLDPLWADAAVDAVGIDNYMPLSDWRDADYAGGNPDGFRGPYDQEGLRASIASGEGFDWYYASEANRVDRVRSPISDGAYGKDWVFRYKDIVGWWDNLHYERHGGVEDAEPTAWVPGSKPVMLTELGCGAVDKGPNQPNVFPDPKSSENSLPYFSNGGRSDLAQSRFLAAHLEHWSATGGAANPLSDVYGGPMLDPADICIWAWDARPFPAFPLHGETWRDGDNWQLGHWLNGRLGGIAVGDLINAILADQGLAAAEVTRADGVASGYLIENPTTARAAIEPVVRTFGLGATETAKGLSFSTSGQGDFRLLDSQMVVIEEDAPSIQRFRDPDTALPARAELDFRDQMNDHQSASADARKPGTASNAETFLGFPGVLARGAAQALVTDWLRRQWHGREQIALAVPAGEAAAVPGTIFGLLDDERRFEYLVTEVETGLSSRIKARRFQRAAPTPWLARDMTTSVADDLVTGPPFAVLLDLPLSSASRTPEEQLRVAARAKPWRVQTVLVSPEDSGFEARGVVPQRATVGYLAESLNGGGFEGRLDEGGAVVVDLLDGELSSVSPAQLLNGANAAAIHARNDVWEIVQFRDAQEIAASRWRLTGLLRGQLGTNDAMLAGADAGCTFVLLNDAVVPAGLRPGEAGLTLNWRVGPRGFDISDAYFTSLTAAGGLRAQLPLSPVHLSGGFQPNGDFGVSWTRRGRIGADDWRPADIPLGEETESYSVAVAAAGGEVVRTETVDSPGWTYEAAEIASDFPQMPDAIEVTVRQISAAVGPGIPASAILPLA
jgi:hypothetical protein